MRLSLFLLVCLSIVISGCVKRITVKHLNPDKPNVLESNEGVVFGRIIFITRSEEMGEVRLPPLGLGLVHVETGKRALRAVMYEKTVIIQPPSGDIVTRELPTERTWFEDGGTFFWVLPTGSYKIDALGWGFTRILFVSDPDIEKPKAERIFPLFKPENPPECGFVVGPNIVFNVSGDSGALYIGSLLIDMDIKKNEHGIEIKNINRIEIKDEYAEALELLKSRYPSCTLTVEKRLMTGTPDRPVSAANRRCPTLAEMFLRETAGGILMSTPGMVFGVPVSPSIILPSIPIGK
jgi:hypothetical protein